MTASRRRVDRRAALGRDGYVLVPGLLDPGAAAELLVAAEAAALADGTPSELTSGTMRFASNLFRHDPDLRRFLRSQDVVELIGELLGPSAWVRWDQAVWKGPGAPEFPCHQDNGYTGRSTEHLQLWVALTDMTPENGGLVVVPGGHTGLLPHRWQGSHAVADLPPEIEARVVEARAGDVVAFSSLLPHSTGPNTTSMTRVAYVAELLPVGVGDPGVPTPHFVACREGRPFGAFVTDAGAPSSAFDAAPAPDRTR